VRRRLPAGVCLHVPELCQHSLCRLRSVSAERHASRRAYGDKLSLGGRVLLPADNLTIVWAVRDHSDVLRSLRNSTAVICERSGSIEVYREALDFVLAGFRG
jgi:hypothetical protein